MKFLLVLLGLVYCASPYDLFPDFFIGPGWVDDLIILGLLLWYLFFYRRRKFGYESYYETSQRASSEEHSEESGEEEAPGTEYDFKEKGTPRDAYSVLGVGRDASSKEIKEAYRRLANQYHPDKVLHLGEEFRELAERRFKEIQTAYQELMAK